MVNVNVTLQLVNFAEVLTLFKKSIEHKVYRVFVCANMMFDR